MIEAIYPFISAGFETAAGFICFGRTAGGGKVSAVRRFLFWLCGYGTCWLPVPFLMRSLIFTAVLCLYGVWGKGEGGKHSFFSALLAAALTELCWGASNSAGMLLAPYVFDAASLSSGRLFMMGSDLAALGLSLLYSRAAQYVLGRRQELPGAFYAPLLLPAGAAAMAGEYRLWIGPIHRADFHGFFSDGCAAPCDPASGRGQPVEPPSSEDKAVGDHTARRAAYRVKTAGSFPEAVCGGGQGILPFHAIPAP